VRATLGDFERWKPSQKELIIELPGTVEVPLQADEEIAQEMTILRRNLGGDAAPACRHRASWIVARIMTSNQSDKVIVARSQRFFERGVDRRPQLILIHPLSRGHRASPPSTGNTFLTERGS
jgi:hypothetical protein